LAPYLNTDTVNAFFRQFEKEADPRIQVFLIWDQAGFHTSNKVRIPSNVTLVPLPAYSPQLNPIEKLWQYLRQHYWSNRVYDNYDQLRQATNDARKRVCLKPKKVKSICRATYLKHAFS